MVKKRPLWRHVDGNNWHTSTMHMTKLHVWSVGKKWFASVHLTCGFTCDSEAFNSAISAKRWAEKEATARLTEIRDHLVREYDLDIKRLGAVIKKQTPKRRNRKKTER